MARKNPHPKLTNPSVIQVAFVAVPNASLVLDDIEEYLTKKFEKTFPSKQIRKKISYVASDKGNLNIEEGPPPDDQPHFRISNKHSNISVGPRYFSADVDQSYNGWLDFSILVSELVEQLYQLGTTGFEFVSLRFENELEITNDIRDTLSDWAVPAKLPFDDASPPFSFEYETINEFKDGVQRVRIKYPSKLISEPIIQEYVSVTIDHSFVSEESGEMMNFEDIINWIEIAHERIYDTFQVTWKPNILEAMR